MTFRPGMTPAERAAAVDAVLAEIDDGSLKAAADAKTDPEWEAKYGDQSWDAALVQLGIPPETVVPERTV